jgi:hypothetical protein
MSAANLDRHRTTEEQEVTRLFLFLFALLLFVALHCDVAIVALYTYIIILVSPAISH